MTALIIPTAEINKFPLPYKGGQWTPLNNTVNGDYWLKLEAQFDLDKAGIEYTIGEVEIKQDELNVE